MKQQRERAAVVILTAIVSLMLATTTMAKPRAKAPEGDKVGVVNINSAAADQLQLLPRIGQTTAQRIIAYRTKRKFRGTYDLVRVKGIGRKTFHRLKPYLTITGPTTLTKKVRSQ